jgi:LPXTG-motif cell wall-anchored protein
MEAYGNQRNIVGCHRPTVPHFHGNMHHNLHGLGTARLPAFCIQRKQHRYHETTTQHTFFDQRLPCRVLPISDHNSNTTKERTVRFMGWFDNIRGWVHRGRYLGFFNLAQSLGWAVAPFVGGILIDTFAGRSPEMWLIISGFAILAAFGFLVFKRKFHGKV